MVLLVHLHKLTCLHLYLNVGIEVRFIEAFEPMTDFECLVHYDWGQKTFGLVTNLEINFTIIFQSLTIKKSEEVRLMEVFEPMTDLILTVLESVSCTSTHLCDSRTPWCLSHRRGYVINSGTSLYCNLSKSFCNGTKYSTNTVLDDTINKSMQPP